MNLQDNNISLKLDISLPKKNKSTLNEQVVTYDGNVDYEKNVINKPKLNGKEIVGDMTEEDPNVQPIELNELSNIFDTVFN